MAEPGVETHRQDAPQEGQVDPCGRGAPIHVAGVPRNRDELQDREGDVAASQRPDPEEIALTACVKPGEADSDEPRPHHPGGQRREHPRPCPTTASRTANRATPTASTPTP